MTSRHLETLLQEFKDFSRLQRLDLQSVPLEPFLAEVEAAWASEAAARNVQLRVDCASNVARAGRPAEASSRLRQSGEECARGDRSRTGRGRRSRSQPIDPGKVRITIADSGPGVPLGDGSVRALRDHQAERDGPRSAFGEADRRWRTAGRSSLQPESGRGAVLRDRPAAAAARPDAAAAAGLDHARVATFFSRSMQRLL